MLYILCIDCVLLATLFTKYREACQNANSGRKRPEAISFRVHISIHRKLAYVAKTHVL
jgi:hypothetical protein